MTNAGTFTGAGGKGSDDTEFNIGGTMNNLIMNMIIMIIHMCMIIHIV